MPRRASAPDSENTVPSTPRVARPRRKRVVSEVVTEETVSEGVSERVEEVVETPAPRPRRKAPTRKVVESVVEEVRVSDSPVSTPRRQKRSRISTIIMAVIFVGAFGLSAALGFSDKGTIDVAAKLQEQGQIQANIAGEQSGSGSQVVPVQNTPVDVPNGGLQGRGLDSSPPPPPPQEMASSTATSTEQSATSTEALEASLESESVPEDTISNETPAPASDTPAQ